MNLLMITLLTVGSAVGQAPAAGNQVGGYDEYYDDCEACRPKGISEHLRNKRAIHNTSPQTCYSPRFGCYHSNERHMNRYPAFHGTFYRDSYNYRNYFDYPWHAQPHEPTSLFSYNVGEDQPPAEMRTSSAPQPARATPVAPPTPPQPPVPPQASRPAPARPSAEEPRVQTPSPAKRSLTSNREIAPSSYLAPASANRRIGSTTPAAMPASAATTSSRRLSSGSDSSR